MIDSNSIRNMITNAALEAWQDEIKARENEARAREERRREREEQYQEQAAIATRALVDAEFGVSNAPLLDDGRLQIDDHVYLKADTRRGLNPYYPDDEIPDGNDLESWRLFILVNDIDDNAVRFRRRYESLEQLGEIINDVREEWESVAELDFGPEPPEGPDGPEPDDWSDLLNRFAPYGLADLEDLNRLEMAQRADAIRYYVAEGNMFFHDGIGDSVMLVKVVLNQPERVVEPDEEPIPF